jgi:SAM-dependent methyltransferase
VPKAEEIAAVVPQAAAMVRANRAFVSETIRRLAAEEGIRQVLDIGAGLGPATVDAVRRADSPARVALVDNDPVTVVHLQGRWERREPLLRAVALYGELCWPETFLRDPRLLDVLDLTAPTAVVLGAVLQHVLDHRAARAAVARTMAAVASGSRLVITHATGDTAPHAATVWAQFYLDAACPLVLRSAEQLAAFFDDLVLEDPGLVALQTPEHEGAAQVWMYGAAGRKP